MKFISLALCHLITVPVWPVNVNTVELVPWQTIAPPLTIPPAELGNTVTFTAVLLLLSQLLTVWVT